MQDYRKLKVWQRSHALVLTVYRVTNGFPKSEIYGITSQMRRAAYSIPSNIAEGRSRSTDRDFARFLNIAIGSASELEYFLLLSKDVGYLAEENWRPMSQEIEEIRKMLTSFTIRLRSAESDSGSSLKAEG